mmetsp:Transcript_43891/g.100534  ORF Transcript_43891/g.100534 Transcript_43891/m.100534 type:complete len:256 (-) Transcript_43891:7-774(-)
MLVLIVLWHSSGIVIEDQDIHDMGTTIVPRLTMAQLQAAYEHYAMKHAHSKFMTTSFSTVNRVLCNHWRSCLKMPAGGANAGGSQQTGFELELITSAGARAIFSSWPNHQFIRLGHTWEARTMEEAELLLCFEELPAGWGVGNAKPAPCTSGSKVHKAILMAAPPITVTYQLRQDTTVPSARAQDGATDAGLRVAAVQSSEAAGRMKRPTSRRGREEYDSLRKQSKVENKELVTQAAYYRAQRSTSKVATSSCTS